MASALRLACQTHVPPCPASPSQAHGARTAFRCTRRPEHGPNTCNRLVRASAAGPPAPQPATPQPPQPRKGQGKEEKVPFQQQVLNGILGIANVPYSSFVPSPVTPLHMVDARIKQLWLIALYVLIARASPMIRVIIAGTIALITVATFPPRLWQSQFKRLGILCGFIFVFTALGADGIPPVLQPRGVPPGIEGLSAIPETGYSYVLLHVFFVTITHRSINLAITAASLTFCALQTASLCLVTTPGEEMALALRWWLTPLRWLRVPVQEVAMTLLLSLRFMSLVFEEVRNLSLGLASRGVVWEAQGSNGSLSMLGRLSMRLFGNLFQRSENIAQAMLVRGFQGPEEHTLYMMKINKTTLLANICALALLAGFSVAIYYYK